MRKTAAFITCKEIFKSMGGALVGVLYIPYTLLRPFFPFDNEDGKTSYERPHLSP